MCWSLGHIGDRHNVSRAQLRVVWAWVHYDLWPSCHRRHQISWLWAELNCRKVNGFICVHFDHFSRERWIYLRSESYFTSWGRCTRIKSLSKTCCWHFGKCSVIAGERFGFTLFFSQQRMSGCVDPTWFSSCVNCVGISRPVGSDAVFSIISLVIRRSTWGCCHVAPSHLKFRYGTYVEIFTVNQAWIGLSSGHIFISLEIFPQVAQSKTL